MLSEERGTLQWIQERETVSSLSPGSRCTCRLNLQWRQELPLMWQHPHTDWGRGKDPHSSPGQHSPSPDCCRIPPASETETVDDMRGRWESEWAGDNYLSHKRTKLLLAELTLTFSLSVPISFLSSLFFSFPGASAMGREVWNTNSFPAQSAAWEGHETPSDQDNSTTKSDHTQLQ